MFTILLATALLSLSEKQTSFLTQGSPHAASVSADAKPKTGKYRVTERTKFYLDGVEVTAEVFLDEAGTVTELAVDGDEILVIKADRAKKKK